MTQSKKTHATIWNPPNGDVTMRLTLDGALRDVLLPVSINDSGVQTFRYRATGRVWRDHDYVTGSSVYWADYFRADSSYKPRAVEA